MLILYIVSAIISILAVLVLIFFCAFYKQDGMTSVLLLVQGLKTAMPSLDFATCNLLLHVYDI